MRLSNGEVLLAWPLAQHIITQGWRYNSGKSHNGIDMRTVIGNTSMRPVYSAEDGTVSATQVWDGHTKDERSMQSYGNRVDISHASYKGKALLTRYAHLSSFCVKVGQKVKEGQLIGYSGATGNVYGAHLHFEVLLGGKRTNPLTWLDDAYIVASSNVYTYGPGEHAVERPADAPAAVNGLQIIKATGLTNAQAWEVYMLATKLDLLTMQLYVAKFADANNTTQDVEVGPVTQGDAKQVLALLDKLGVQGKATVEAVQDAA